ncbi:hypothetical protein FC07_GL000325 [Loigolactobacillus bifermentans DSM 20003]|uniref:Uncharacterized protein n=2 Tax=Loigolactobacillus bifermentans TaxID=1607 RepID=A0A0R1GLV4_9LACO|nr:hypothetical protein FC07_GL000325 [Loigolactobacillus bifermentans DSM 20003]
MAGDFLAGNSFGVSVTDNLIGVSQHELIIQYQLKNDDLQQLINRGDAKVVAHFESGLTSFREIAEFPEARDTLRFEIDSTKMMDTIDLTVMIVANKAIAEYRNSGFNPDMFGSNYCVRNLSRGDILAFEPSIEIQLEMQDLAASGPKTLIKVAKSEATLLNVNLDSDVIRVELPEAAYAVYSQLQNAKEMELANVALLLPALISAVDDIKFNESDSDYLWYKELMTYIYEGLHYTEDSLKNASSIIVAQQILSGPIIKAFNALTVEED